MAGDPSIEIEGAKELRAALRATGSAWPKELRKGYKRISDHVADAGRRRATSLGGVHALSAPGIRPYATQTNASVGVREGRVEAVGIWGAKKHTGWYARERYASSPPQHPEWVGNNWEPATVGQGPYGLNDALAREVPWVLDAFADVVLDVTGRAFPD